MAEKKTSVFFQEYELRIGQNKDKIKNVFYAKALQVLKEPPFRYSDRICKEVAWDIIDKGAKLMTNSCEDRDDEDREMKDLNNMGDEFQGLQTSTLLFLSVDEENHNTDEERIKELMPMPPKPLYNIKHEDVSTLPAFLEKMRNFLMHTAKRSFSTTIVVMGECNEDGVKFGNGATVPRHVLEMQANQVLKNSEEHCPLTLDMVFLGKGDQVHVTTMPKTISEDFNPNRVILVKD